MIKKLENSEQSIYDSNQNFIGTMPTLSSGAILGKINELVDAVNKLETMAKNTNTVLESLVQENNIHEKQIDELQMKVEPEKCETPVDPYANQHKWIGKLCWFWDEDKKDGSYGVLGYIKEGWERCYVQKGHYFAYEHCEPASEDLIYKGGDNE